MCRAVWVRILPLLLFALILRIGPGSVAVVLLKGMASALDRSAPALLCAVGMHTPTQQA